MSCPSVQITSLSAGRRDRVIPLATILASHRIGAPPARAFRAAAAKPGENRMSSVRSTMPQAWIIRMATRASTSDRPERSASERMVAKDFS